MSTTSSSELASFTTKPAAQDTSSLLFVNNNNMAVFRKRTPGSALSPQDFLLRGTTNNRIKYFPNNYTYPRGGGGGSGGSGYPDDIDDDKYRSKHSMQDPQKRLLKMCAIMLVLYALKKAIFPLSHDTMNYIDNTARRLWLHAEEMGIIESFPPYKLDYEQDFPYFSILETNYMTIRQEAEQLLERNRQHIPRLKDLVDNKLKVSKVYKTDWKTFWLKMGSWIPENCVHAPQTCQLLEGIPGVYNAFFSVLNAKQQIDPHWGHYKGFLRYHLGLIVPNNNEDKKCYLRIRNDIEKNTTLWLYEREALLEQGETYYWHEGEGVMFDDNPLHDATNDSDGERVVLFLDVARKLPWYLDIVNRIAIYVANQQKQITSMRKRAVLDVSADLTPIG